MTLDYERLNAKAISQAIGTADGESVIVRTAFRWMCDGEVLPGAYESFCMETVCNERGWEIVARYGNHIAIVRVSQS